MALCIECGTNLPDVANFCFNCGVKLAWEPPPAYEPPPPAPAYEPPMMSFVPTLATDQPTPSWRDDDAPWPEDPPGPDEPAIEELPRSDEEPKPPMETRTGARTAGARTWSFILRNKLVTAAATVVVLVAIVAVANSNDPGTSGVSNDGVSATQPGVNQALKPGEAATIGSIQVTVTAMSFQQSITEFALSGYLVADVTYINLSQATQSYQPTEWTILRPNGTPGGQPVSAEGQLGPGQLPAGGTAGGKVSFEVGAEKGDFVLIWKPTASASAPAQWKVTI